MGLSRMALRLVLLAGIAGVGGHHFQYGSISFQEIAPNTVRFDIFTQWERSFGSFSVYNGSGPDGRAVTGDSVDMFGIEQGGGEPYGVQGGLTGPVKFFTGDGEGFEVQVLVTEHSVGEDFIYGKSEFVHQYAELNDGGSDWLPFLKGCCREGGGNFMVTARLNLARERLSLVARGLPVISLPIPTDGRLLRIPLPASTDEGVVGSGWRLGAGTEIGGAVLPSADAVYFESSGNGNMTVNASTLGVGRFPVVVILSSTGSVVPFDFTLRLHTDRGLPHFMGNPLMTDASTMLQTGIPLLEGYVGYEVYFTITARTDRPNATMKGIRVFSLPRGSRIESRRSLGGPGNSTMEIDFRWLPAVEQSGTHYMCTEATHADVNVNASAPPLTPSTPHCVRIYLRAVNPSPVFTTPANGSTIVFNLASRGSFEVGGLNLNPYDQLTLTPKFPLLPGQELSPPFITNGRIKATDTAQRVEAFAVFSWTPSAEFGAFRQNICFILSQQGGPGLTPFSSERCILVEVERCRYVAQEGDTFESIAQIFGMDWLTLWGLNTHVETFVPTAGMTVQIGRFYTAQPGDTLLTVSREFGTSIDRMRALNYDLRDAAASTGLSAVAGDRGLLVGSIICMLPDTCQE